MDTELGLTYEYSKVSISTENKNYATLNLSSPNTRTKYEGKSSVGQEGPWRTRSMQLQICQVVRQSMIERVL